MFACFCSNGLSKEYRHCSWLASLPPGMSSSREASILTTWTGKVWDQTCKASSLSEHSFEPLIDFCTVVGTLFLSCTIFSAWFCSGSWWRAFTVMFCRNCQLLMSLASVCMPRQIVLTWPIRYASRDSMKATCMKGPALSWRDRQAGKTPVFLYFCRYQW